MSNLYQINVKEINGTEKTLSDKKGKVLLIVNVASKCGLTPQYEALEALYANYRDRDFEVLGFPANNFMGQEPGSDDEIQQFCKMNFDIKFPMYSKISVEGSDQHPLYIALTQALPVANNKGDASFRNKLAGLGHTPKNENDVLWNFEKFLINRDGQVVARFSPEVPPTDPIITEAIEAELNKKAAQAV
jgi:glutathione peroxidase